MCTRAEHREPVADARLRAFAQACPDISLNLSAATRTATLRSGSDIDIRYGVPRWPDLVVEPLFEERIVPWPARHHPGAALEAARAFARRAADPEQRQRRPVPDWFAAFSDRRAPDASLGASTAPESLDAATRAGRALESATIAAGISPNASCAGFGLEKAIKVKRTSPSIRRARQAAAGRAFLSWLHGEAAKG